MDSAMKQIDHLAKGTWQYFVLHVHSPASIYHKIGNLIQLGKCCLDSICFKLEYSYSWKYSIQRVLDGNFSAEKLQTKNPLDDVELSNGTGFITAEDNFNAHLKIAREMRPVCSSSQYVLSTNITT